MKITNITGEINLNQIMDISVDVHKDTLNFFFCYRRQGIHRGMRQSYRCYRKTDQKIHYKLLKIMKGTTCG